MKIAISKENLLLMIVSAVIAILLWLQVQSQINPSIQREYSIPLEQRHLPENLIVTHTPSRVTVVAEGSQSELKSINPDEIEAYVDLSKAQIGQKSYPVKLRIFKKNNAELTLQHPIEVLKIERLLQKEFPVKIEARGLPPSDLIYDGAGARPDKVILQGPESALAKVVKVRAMFNLPQIKPGESYPATVEILGAVNRPVPFIHAEPSVVMIHPGVAAAPANKRVLISPLWEGEPAFGYKVSQYQLKPNQVKITGNIARVARTNILDTQPIPIQGLQKSKTFYVSLKVPVGIQVMDNQKIEVRVHISSSIELDSFQTSEMQ